MAPVMRCVGNIDKCKDLSDFFKDQIVMVVNPWQGAMERRQAAGGSVMLWEMFCLETMVPGIHMDVTLTRTSN